MAIHRIAVLVNVAALVIGSVPPAIQFAVAKTTAQPVVQLESISGGTTTRVSVDSSGAQANNESAYTDISGDGRYVVFESPATNLVPSDTNGRWDIFLRDRQSGTTTRVSVSSSGAEANGDSHYPQISANGRYVTFQSSATNLVADDTNAATDVFIRDLVAGTTTRIVSTSGVQGNAGSQAWAPMSADGRYILFYSGASNFGGAAGDLFIHDQTTGDTSSIGYHGVAREISADARYVVFTTSQNLVPEDTGSTNNNDVYVLDRTTGTLTFVSISYSGGASDGNSDGVSISGDGRFVAFSSTSSNLVATDTNGTWDVFVRDLSTNTTTLASVTTSGVQPGGASNYPWISTDGHIVAFRSAAVLDPSDTNGMVDVYARDLQSNETMLISVGAGGTLGNNWSEYPALSDNGLVIAFYSYASNLVNGDTNATRDVFVNDRSSGLPDYGTSFPYTFGRPTADAFSPDPVNIATGSFTAQADDLVLPGRVLGFDFRRSYNSADDIGGPLGPGWTHSYNWTVTDGGSTVEVRCGDGRRDTFTRNQDGSYADPPDVFDTLVKNADSTYRLTLTSQVQYEFSTAGQLVRIHEPAGNRITLAYTSGNLTTITDTVGRQVTLSYDGSNRLTQLQDPLGRKVTYAYDADGRLATVTDKIGNAPGQNPALHRWTYGYDGATRHITTVTDPDGRVRVTNTYDAEGRVYQQRDGLNALTQITYGTGQTTLTDPRGHDTVYTFDSRMRVLSQRDIVGTNTYTLSYAYDAAGNRTSVTDRNGKMTDFTYDGHGNVLTKTDPQVDPQTPRYLTQFQYDPKNNLTQITDPRLFVTTMTYDPTTNVLLSVSRQIDAATYAVTKYEYGDPANSGLPTKIIAPRGNTGPTPNYTYSTSLSYDTQGNLVQRIDADGAKTTYAYDGAGRLASFVDPDGYASGANPAEHTWLVGYDENDRETGRTDPLAHVLAYGYDGAGDRTTVADRDGNVTAYSYGANTRLATTQQQPDPVGQPTLVYTTGVTRDGNGNATRTTQANGVVTDYGFDALDRVTDVTTHPDAQTNLATSYVLDGNGQPLSRTTADGTTVNYSYDALSRLTAVSAPGLATISYGYDATGERTQMVDGTGTTTYQYDGLGRVTQVAAPNGTLSYAYDLDGNRTTLGYPGSQDVTYAYSPGGRMTTVTDWASRVSTYTYQSSGLVSTLSYPNGMVANYTYDRAQRLTQLINAVGQTTITSDTYTLDPEGNRTAIDEYVQGITPPVLTWAASVQVNDVTTGQQDRPDIEIGADGAAYLIWDDYRSGTNGDIYFSRRDPTTGAWSANQKVNDDTTTRTQWEPAIAVDGSNNAYAVWSDQRDGSKTADTNIYASKRGTSTGTWSANVRVNDDTRGTASQGTPRIAVKSTGDAVAVWEDHRSSQWNIYSARLPAGSSTWSTNMRVTDNTTSRKYTPDVVVAADGTAYAVWEDDRSGNSDIWFSTLPAGTSTWSANVKISDDPGTAAQYAPRIGIDTSGNLYVVWLDDRVPSTEVRMSRRLAGSQTWEASRVISDASAVPVSLAFAVSSDGSGFAVWQDGRGSSYDIWGAEYSAVTNSWSSPSAISDDPSSTAQMRPTVARTSVEVQSAWRDDRTNGGDIRARRRTTSRGEDRMTYAYDGLNRLTAVAGPVAETFSFDAGSNISARTGPSATNTYDTANRQTSDGTRSFVWDGADRLITRGADTFSYDALSRLKSATVGGTTRAFSYDGDGLLASRPEGALLWDSSVAPAPLVQSGTDEFVYGLAPLYVAHTDGTALTLARDGLGSVRAELSDTGAVSRSFRYAAYGTLASSFGGTPTIFGYASELTDASGLINLRARWYDSATGRFMSRDAFAGLPEAPVTLDAYGYAYGSPVRFTDSSGNCPFCLVMAVGAVAGAVINTSVYVVGSTQRGDFTWGGLAGAVATGAIIGAVAPVAGPLGGSAGAAFAINVGLGAIAYGLGGFAEDTVNGALGLGTTWTPSLEGLVFTSVGAGIGGALGEAVSPMRGLNTLRQFRVAAPRTWQGFMRQGPNMQALEGSSFIGALYATGIGLAGESPK